VDSFLVVLHDCTDNKLLSRCAWVSLANGRTCVYDYACSVAHHIDVFQQALLNSQTNNLTICGINIDADNELPSARLHAPAVHFLGLLRVLTLLLGEHWDDSYEEIAEHAISMKDTSSAQLDWKPRLPSTRSLSPEEPSLLRLDILLTWVHERLEIDTFLGFQDWSIYLSEPYTRHPTLRALHIVMVSVGSSTRHRMMLITNSGDMLAHLKEEQDRSVETNGTDVTINPETQVAALLLASLTFIIEDVSQYIAHVMKLVQALVNLFQPRGLGSSLMTQDRICRHGAILHCLRCKSYCIFANATNGPRKPAAEMCYASLPSFDRNFQAKEISKTELTIANILLANSKITYNKSTTSERLS
jgi:hypothetical protein